MEIYTDGSCIQSQGNGGWAVVFSDGRILSGAESGTTSNRMELVAIIEALRRVEGRATIYSDSQYAVNVLMGKYKARKNLDLVREGRELMLNKYVKLQWVRGHNGHRWNELADTIANAARDGELWPATPARGR